MAVPSTTSTALAHRIYMAGAGTHWYAVILADLTCRGFIDDLSEDLQGLGVRATATAPRDRGGFLQVLHSKEPSLAVIVPADVRAEDWRSVDLARDRVRRHATTVVATTVDGYRVMAESAPNLVSFMVGQTFSPASDDYAVLDASEVEARLEALRRDTGLSDRQFMEQVTSGNMPDEPWAAQWLVLLDRGDLLLPHE